MMFLRRAAIGIGIALAVIAPLVVATFANYALADFVNYFGSERWGSRALPGITTFVIGSRGGIVGALMAVSFLVAGVFVSVAMTNRERLLGTTAVLTICSLHVSLVAGLLVLLSVWLPIVAEVTMIGKANGAWRLGRR